MYKRHKRFSDGRLATFDDNVTGRPTVMKDRATSLVRNAIDNDRRLIVREIAEMTDISKSTVHRILTEKFEMDRVCARWILKLLSEGNKLARVKAARAFLRKFKSGGERFLDRIITTDETWLHYFEPES